MFKRLCMLAVLGLAVTGCASKPAPSSIAGVYKSIDHGETWKPKNLLLHSGGAGSLANASIGKIFLDPQDPNALYLGTINDGILYSYDGGESWMQVRAVSKGRVYAIAIDPKDKCTLYATLNNTIVKSTDCNRSWREVYIDTVATKALTALTIDSFNPQIVYAGNVVGDVLKSIDAGLNWKVVQRTQARVTAILLDSQDTRVIYVATDRRGISKSVDAGTTWLLSNDGLRPYSGSLDFRQLQFMPDTPNALLLTSKYGLLVSTDGAATWNPIKLLTPPTSTDIFATVVNPKNSKEIFYATASTFYKTVDGGVTWVTKRLPTIAVPSYLFMLPQQPDVMLFGMTVPVKK